VTALEEAQSEVAALHPHPYYLEAYRAAEFSYWQQDPRVDRS